jgi:hypothetical protein
MQEPQGDEGQELKRRFKLLSSDNRFSDFLDWVKAERDARDEENRVTGHENTTSEAGALSLILEVTGHEIKQTNTVANAVDGANDGKRGSFYEE